ncbi:hypothetical protein X953_03585 [Virgibacillus sp. SK37]|nr:hypothetical protein X953_03585 [Virgibacillus sp. SK37]
MCVGSCKLKFVADDKRFEAHKAGGWRLEGF